MYSFYESTPYKLNLKLKNLNKNLSKSSEINNIYNNLNESIPIITTEFCFLKNKTSALNRTLNNNPRFIDKINESRANINSFSTNSIVSPDQINYDYNISYTTPTPVLKTFKKISNKFPNYKNGRKMNIKNKLNNKNQFKLNYKYKSYKNIPIKISKNNNSFNNMVKHFNFSNRNNNNKIYENDNNIEKNIYNRQFQKLNEQICEKNKIIQRMQGILDDTFDKLNIKTQENSILQSQILELKSQTNDSNYNSIKNIKINENNRYIKINKNKNNINEKQNINLNKNKKNNTKLILKKYKNFNEFIKNKNYNKSVVKKDNKWEEIKKLNKKMDNLLIENEKKIKKYERIRGKYNNYKKVINMDNN